MAEVVEANVSKRARDFFDRGLAALERSNLSYAMDMFAASLEIEPRFLKARKFLRAAALRQFNDTRKHAPATHTLALLSALPAYVSALVALKTGKTQKALLACDQLLRSDPLNLPFIRLFCRAAEAMALPEAAIQTMAIAREYYADNVEFLTHLGQYYQGANRLDEAKECFEAVATLRPHDAKVMKHLKDVLARETMDKGGWGDVGKDGYRAGMKDAKEAARLEQEHKGVKTEKNIEMLLQDAQEKVQREPENMNYRRQLANLYLQATRFNDALRTMEEARRAAGAGDPSLDQMMATIRVKQFEYEIAQCRENGDTAGVAAKTAEREAFLFKDVQARVERYPTDLPLRYEYGVLLYERDQLNEAIQQLQLAQRNAQRRTRALYYMALCFKKKQQWDMAREQLERASSDLAEMNDLKKDIFYELGDTLDRMGRHDEAVSRYYKEIYQVDIGYKDVAAKIEQSYQA